MEYRMYCLSERHLSSIQKTIQGAHAIVEYGLTYGDSPEYKKWAGEDKTIIVLDGGNSSDLDSIKNQLVYEKLPFEVFYEPDMDNFMTSIALLVDERVWDTKTYGRSYEHYRLMCEDDPDLPKWNHDEWVNWIGGETNEILKKLIFSLKLAI